ncbi:MAG: hypothetical protein QF475_03095, partial [Candidatus Undinarchaeales archaeon]|nr:hypothetical protein [Candidatus Undinarchaeales archaeon]
MKKLPPLIALFLLILLICSIGPGINPNGKTIHLKSRSITPTNIQQFAANGADQGNSPTRKIIQLDHIPTDAEKAEFAQNGVHLLNYIPDNAWFARITPSGESYLGNHGLTFSGDLSSSDKIADTIEISESEQTQEISIVFFPDVSTSEARTIVESYGSVVSEPVVGNVWLAEVQENQV